MPHFICPNCGNRSIASERTAGFRDRARGCSKCGFGFVFELLDDYYPAPNAAFFICDQEARLIGAGRGARELTGLGDDDVIGRPVQEVLGLEFQIGRRPHRHRARVGRPGARQAGYRSRGGRPARAGEGRHLPGVRRRRRPAARPHAQLADRAHQLTASKRNLSSSASCCWRWCWRCSWSSPARRSQADAPRPRPEGRRRAGLPGPADAEGPEGHAAGDRATRSRRSASAPTPSACPSPRSSARAPTRSRSACRRSRTPARAEQQVGTTAQLQFYDWEPNLLPPNQAQPTLSIFTAVQTASKQKPKAEADDIPPGGPSAAVKKQFGGNQQKIEQYYDRQNDTAGDKYYLFGPGKRRRAPADPSGPGRRAAGAAAQQAATNDATAFYESCKEIADDFEGTAAKTPPTAGKSSGKPAKGTACPATLQRLAAKGIGPPAGSLVVKVPRGHRRGQGPAARHQQGSRSATGCSRTTRSCRARHQGPEAGLRPADATSRSSPSTSPTRGAQAFARATKREAERGSEDPARAGRRPRRHTFQRFAITLDNQIVSLATINYQRQPRGHRRPDRRPDQRHRQHPGRPRTWPRACASARCRSR